MLPSSLLISNGNNGDFLYDGTNQYFACLNNGDLCFCSINKGVLFSSHSITNGNGAFLIFTNDGKLSVVDKSGTTLWITNNVAVNGGTFKIQENGDYVIFDENANPIWSQRGIVPGSNVLLSA
jgi:hypothetical protein